MDIPGYILSISITVLLIYTHWQVRSRHTALLLAMGLTATGLDVSLLEHPEWFRTGYALARSLHKPLIWLWGLVFLAFVARNLWPYPLLFFHPQKILKRGDEFLKCGRFERAGQCYRQVLAWYSGWAYPHCGLGWAFLMTGRFESAHHEFSQALKLQPDLAEAHNGLVASHVRLNKLALAEAELRSASASGPDQLHAHLGLGLVLLRTNRQDEARSLLDPILFNYDPTSVKQRLIEKLIAWGWGADIPQVLEWVNDRYQQRGSIGG